jgi:flagellar hook-basal body complex protein FliE
MTDVIINGGFKPAGITPEKTAGEKQAGDKAFGSVLKDAIQDINKLQSDADKAIAKVQMEDAGSIHEAMTALEKADISFRVMMQVRNKILDAYQEVMRMQI